MYIYSRFNYMKNRYLCHMITMQNEYTDRAVGLLRRLIATPSVSRDEAAAALIVEDELRRYGSGLSGKPRVVIVTKTDLPESAAAFEELKKSLLEETVLPLSSFTREGLETVALTFLKLAEGQPL